MRISKVGKAFVLVLLLVLLGGGATSTLAGTSTLTGTSTLAGTGRAGEEKENLSGAPFSPGEKLTFRVIYFALPAGTAVLEVKEVTSWEGHEVYHLVARVWSSPLFSLFYRVRNRMESLLDRETFLPHRFEGHREEREHRSQQVILFDRDQNLALTFEAEEKEVDPQWVSTPVSSQVQDVLSALYYLRRRNLKVGESFFVDVNMGRRNYQIEVEVLRKEKLGRRRLETIVVRPLLKRVEMGGILEERGNAYIWFTNDERRLPVLIKIQVAIGSLTIMLVDEELGE